MLRHNPQAILPGRPYAKPEAIQEVQPRADEASPVGSEDYDGEGIEIDPRYRPDRANGQHSLLKSANITPEAWGLIVQAMGDTPSDVPVGDAPRVQPAAKSVAYWDGGDPLDGRVNHGTDERVMMRGIDYSPHMYRLLNTAHSTAVPPRREEGDPIF